MKGRSPQLSAPPAASEVQSTLTVMDFFQSWMYLRRWFAGGLLLVCGVTFIANKFRTEYFRAETRIFVGRNILPEQRIGLSDLELSAIGRNDQFINLVNAVLAEQYLTSTRLLVETANGLRDGKFNEQHRQRWDLYDMLKIREKDTGFREAKLADRLQGSLVQVRQIQNSGMLLFSVELPNPQAAREFANSCTDVLRERFDELEFGYYDAAREQYKARVASAIQESQRLAESRAGIELDHYPSRDQQNEILKWQLEEQARWIAEMNTKVGKLELATTSQSKAALFPLRVVDPAYIPIRKSRPHVTLNTLLAGALFTFVFMLGLVGKQYVGWSVNERRGTRDEGRAGNDER